MKETKINFEYKVLEKAIRHFGKSAQKNMLFEEMAELQKEICKEKRGFGNMHSIVEEMADVYIVLEQLKIIYGITDDHINDFIIPKLKRLNIKIDDEVKARRKLYHE